MVASILSVTPAEAQWQELIRASAFDPTKVAAGRFYSAAIMELGPNRSDPFGVVLPAGAIATDIYLAVKNDPPHATNFPFTACQYEQTCDECRFTELRPIVAGDGLQAAYIRFNNGHGKNSKTARFIVVYRYGP
jgi:hypothetical protein